MRAESVRRIKANCSKVRFTLKMAESVVIENCSSSGGQSAGVSLPRSVQKLESRVAARIRLRRSWSLAL
jgi:hypothetical protein